MVLVNLELSHLTRVLFSVTNSPKQVNLYRIIMNNLQFNLDEDPLYSPISPEVVDISSGSEDGFLVEPGNTFKIDEKFRINPTGTNLMSAFMGTTSASLFPETSDTATIVEEMDTAGTRLEKELMELVGDTQGTQLFSPSSFMDSEFEETDSSPPDLLEGTTVSTNSYGRPIAAILPTPRAPHIHAREISQPIPIYPPKFRPENTDFQIVQNNEMVFGNTMDQPMPSLDTIHTVMPLNNMTPVIIQLPMRGAPDRHPQMVTSSQPLAQIGFPFNVAHSTNHLLLPTEERQRHRLIPTVMPNVAGYCDWCGKSFDQVALETLGEYLAATAYEGETVRDRGVRSRAFIDGFKLALFCFKSAGLSQPYYCAGPVVQQ